MEALVRADTAVVLWLNGWVGTLPWLDEAVRWVSSDYLMPVTMALLLLGAWFGPRSPEARERHQRAVLMALVAMGLANMTVEIINGLYWRPRPYVLHPEIQVLFYRPPDPSFPSNPAVVGFSLATAFARSGNRSLTALLYLLATLWPLARLYAGVFYPTDVLAGALIGALWGPLTARLFRLAEPLPSRALRLARLLYLA